MQRGLELSCPSAGALADLLRQAGATDTLLLPQDGSSTAPEPLQAVPLTIRLPLAALETACEVLQVLPGAGLVIRLLQPDEVKAFAAGSSRSEPTRSDPEDATPPADPADEEAALFDPSDAVENPRARRTSSEVPAVGITVLSWTIERLRTDWHTLSIAEKVRIARYGKRPARALVLKSGDNTLVAFLLQNSRITADEVALIAGMGNLDADLLRRLANSTEWTRHTPVTRNLVCHPKLPLPQVKKLLDKLPLDELRRLAKSGRVRASTKQLIVRKIGH